MPRIIEEEISAYRSALKVEDSDQKSRIIGALDNLDRLTKAYCALVFEEVSSTNSYLRIDLPWRVSDNEFKDGEAYMKLERHRVTIIPKVIESPPKKRLPNYIDSVNTFVWFLDAMSFVPDNMNVDNLENALNQVKAAGYDKDVCDEKVKEIAAKIRQS